MEDIIMTILLFGMPALVGVVSIIGVIVKIVKDHNDQEKDLSYITASIQDIDINCIRRQIEALGTLRKDNPPNRGSHVIQPHNINKRPKLTNCKNCGAVLHSNKCEFCDTEYDW